MPAHLALKNVRMNEIMGYAEAAPTPSFVPTPSSNVVLPQSDNFDGDSATGYFESEPDFEEQEEDICQYSLAVNPENHMTPVFTRAQHLRAHKEEEEERFKISKEKEREVASTSNIKSSQENMKAVAEGSSSANFDIVDSLMKNKVQISQLEYLQDHPEQVD